MKTFVWYTGALVVSLFAIGCTPSPEKVCKKMTELVENDPDMKKFASKASDEDKKKGMDKCIEKLAKAKEEEPEAYKCNAKCLMDVTEWKGLKDCDEKCPKAKKDKDNDTEKASKKKDDDGDKKDDDKKK